VYYVFFTLIRLIFISVQGLGGLILELLNYFPLYHLVIFFTHPELLPSGIRFAVYDNNHNNDKNNNNNNYSNNNNNSLVLVRTPTNVTPKTTAITTTATAATTTSQTTQNTTITVLIHMKIQKRKSLLGLLLPLRLLAEVVV